MLVTTVFFFALLLTFAFFKRMLNDSFSTSYDPLLDDNMEPILWIVTTFLWSWLFYLLH